MAGAESLSDRDGPTLSWACGHGGHAASLPVTAGVGPSYSDSDRDGHGTQAGRPATATPASHGEGLPRRQAAGAAARPSAWLAASTEFD